MKLPPLVVLFMLAAFIYSASKIPQSKQVAPYELLFFYYVYKLEYAVREFSSYFEQADL
jgi:hypothetical protein